MDTTLKGRRTARALAVVLLAGSAAIGLAACQTPHAVPAEPAPAVAPQTTQISGFFGERYAGLPADRIEDQLLRDRRGGQLPDTTCLRHVAAEHPDGGYHLVCVQTRE